MNSDNWKPLIKLGAVGALITAVLIPIQAIVFIVWPPPIEGTVIEWFTLFNKNWLIGLLSLDLLLVVDYGLLIPIILCLYVLLKKVNEPLILLGVVLFFVAISTYIPSNTMLEMWKLSKEYTKATTEADKAVLLAAGKAMTTTYVGTAFHSSYIIGQLAGIIVSFVMLKSKVFSKPTAYAGIIGNAVGYGLYIPTVGIYISLISVIGLWMWYILIARRLFKLI
jgi:hypothetical protein